MAVLYYFSVSIFIFDVGLLYSGAMGTSVGFTDFYRSEVLDGNVCLPQHVVFDAGSVTTRVKCAVLCTKIEPCFGIFYHQEDHRCTGCSYFLHTSALAQAGTKFYGRKGYEINGKKLTWTGAKDSCEARGGSLVSINSELEKDFVNGILHMNNVNKVWIGLNDMSTEGVYLWEDGTTLLDTPFLSWNWGQPNNYQNQDCIHLVTCTTTVPEVYLIKCRATTKKEQPASK